MNSLMVSFATKSRFLGWKSSERMLYDTSSTSIMSTPSVVTSSSEVPFCGRASATTSRPTPTQRSTIPAWRKNVICDFGNFLMIDKSEYRTAGRFFSLSRYSHTSGTQRSSNNKNWGFLSCMGRLHRLRPRFRTGARLFNELPDVFSKTVQCFAVGEPFGEFHRVRGAKEPFRYFPFGRL